MPRAGSVLALQRIAGNHAVVRTLQRKRSDPLRRKKIQASVGKGGYNLPDDLATIQFLLNDVPVADGGPASPLTSDGVASGSNFTDTLAAILNFQQHQDGLFKDGRVDPGEKTLARLNSYDSMFGRLDPGDIVVPSDPPAPPAAVENPRHLNTREGDLLRKVYRDKLDTGKILLTFNALLGAGSTRTLGNTIDVEGPTIDDHTLVHEAGHCYQYQRGDHYVASSLAAQGWAALTHWGDRNPAYDYSDVVAKSVAFDDWNSEQQAEWIADNNTLPPSRLGLPGYP
ncbi:MAG: hypothetical protein ABSH51_30115 [Solirubrobacteraceae bacterium]|jgi:hypothetical protein